jgi:hypothetical protein
MPTHKMHRPGTAAIKVHRERAGAVQAAVWGEGAARPGYGRRCPYDSAPGLTN